MRLPLLLVCLIASSLARAESITEWKVLPSGRLFPLTFADPREIRMGLAVESGSRITAMIGNYFSLVGYENRDTRVHWGLEGAGYFGLRQSDSRFPLETTDGLLGAYTEARWGNFATQLRYTHISAHLADGSSETPLPYSREFVSLRFAIEPDPLLALYAGVSKIVNSIPVTEPWAVQLGAHYFLPFRTSFVVPFAAADLKWKQEAAQNPSLSAQLGIALNDPPEAYRSFRIYYGYFTGSDARGQFAHQSYTSHFLGIEMQI